MTELGERMFKFSLRCIATAGSLLLLVLASARASAEPPGILWETTSQTVMEGLPMQMPAMTSRSCAAKEWKQPPPSGDQSCKTTEFKVVGNKATWSVQCTGDMPMSGVGEMTFNGTDSYTGIVKFSAQGMNMTVRMTGKKVGTCDDPQ